MTAMTNETIEIEAISLRNPELKPVILIPSSQSYQKWVMLAILSVLSTVNQAICYSYAPISSIVEERWEHRLHAETLITIYFVSYIPTAFIGSWIMDKKGLGCGVLLGGILQALGAGLRYFACFLTPAEEVYVTIFGQVLASLAMPFMVNSPPLLSANWFPPSMRATSTSTALNANALGTAIVYLIAPLVVRSSDDVPNWNLSVTVLAVGSCVVAVIYFRSDPNSSHKILSAASSSNQETKYDWSQWWAAFKHVGFWQTVVAFSWAECIVNAFSALLDKILAGTSINSNQVGIVGAAFIVSSLIGGQAISVQVDKKQNHKIVTIVCLLLTALSLALFQVVPKTQVHATLVSLLILGAVVGPIQPVVLELGVECSYPTSEATVAALQQLCGNILSAIAVPGLSALQRSNIRDRYFYVSPEGIMALTTLATLVVFCFFNGKHKRHDHETKIVLPRTIQDQEIEAITSVDMAQFG